jgi:hypothetical protein
LSFKNTWELHQKVDSLPDRAGPWREKTLSFRNHPDEEFTLWYRNSLEAVKALMGDPSLKKDIVYRLQKIFTEGQEKKCVRTEMWTGDWWWTMQL